MTLSVPDHALKADRHELAEFMLTFARFEYAVKAAGFARNKHGHAEPDWDAFCSSITTDFWSVPELSVRPLFRYILEKPPKRLSKLASGRLTWKPRMPEPEWSEARKLLHLAQGVRNNVVHGSKFTAQEDPELNRNAKLMAAAAAILEGFVSNSSKVREVFYGFAP